MPENKVAHNTGIGARGLSHFMCAQGQPQRVHNVASKQHTDAYSATIMGRPLNGGRSRFCRFTPRAEHPPIDVAPATVVKAIFGFL